MLNGLLLRSSINQLIPSIHSTPWIDWELMIDWLTAPGLRPPFAKSIHQQSLHFSSFINHFFIYWPPINLKKWIDWREWRVDELNGAVLCRIQLNKAKQFTIPILKENCEIVLAVVGAVRPILPGSTKFINNLSFCSFINSFTKIKLLSKLSLTR